eukprot:s626_g2.t1
MALLGAESGPARRGDVEKVRELVAARADLAATQPPENYTAVHQAAMGGHVEVLRVLANARADLGARDVRRLCAAHLAADAGQVDVIRFLHSANPTLLEAADGAGKTPVHRAAQRGRTDVLEALEDGACRFREQTGDLGVDLSVETPGGKTVAHLAAEAGQNNVLRFLPPSQCVELLKLTESIMRGEKPIKSMWEKDLLVMCHFFERGRCLKGERCNHAHGPEDLRRPPPREEDGTAGVPSLVSPVATPGKGDRNGASPLPLADLTQAMASIAAAAAVQASQAAVFGMCTPPPETSSNWGMPWSYGGIATPESYYLGPSPQLMPPMLASDDYSYPDAWGSQVQPCDLNDRLDRLAPAPEPSPAQPKPTRIKIEKQKAKTPLWISRLTYRNRRSRRSRPLPRRQTSWRSVESIEFDDCRSTMEASKFEDG